MLKKEVPVRSYMGEKWITNTTNKKYLAIDFKHRCAYCDDLDSIYGGQASYAVEHFAPKGKFPQLKYTYDNLLYACRFCNTSKSDDWPSKSSSINVVGERGYIDPCTDEYYKHLIIFMVEKLYKKREELIASIDKDTEKGFDVSIKQQTLLALDKEFFSYYGQLYI